MLSTSTWSTPRFLMCHLLRLRRRNSTTQSRQAPAMLAALALLSGAESFGSRPFGSPSPMPYGRNTRPRSKPSRAARGELGIRGRHLAAPTPLADELPRYSQLGRDFDDPI